MLKNIFKKVLQQKVFSKVSIIIIVGVVVLAGGIIIYRHYHYQPPFQTEQISTANWKTYQSKQYGFEIKYPEEWHVFNMPEDIANLLQTEKIVFSNLSEEEATKFSIIKADDVSNFDEVYSFAISVIQSSLEDWLKEQIRLSELTNLGFNWKTRDIVLGDNKAYQIDFSFSSLGPEGNSKARVIPREEKPVIYIIETMWPEQCRTGKWNGKCKIFGTMASTFKIIEQAQKEIQGIEVIPKIIQETKTAPAEVTYQIDVSYPELQGLSSGAVQEHVNNAIAGQISALIAEFKQSAAESMAYQGQPGSNALEINYTVEFLNDNFLNILYFKTSDALGAAHPYSGVFVFNYDLSRDKVLELQDLFRPDANYLEAVSELVIADLISQDISDEAWIRRGAGPEAENFQNFVLSNDGLTIYFNPYQVDSYMGGIHKAVIPYEKLKDTFSPEIFQ